MSWRYQNGATNNQKDARTQLFGGSRFTAQNKVQSRASSPYDPPSQLAKFDESYLSSLESQNEEELDSMSQKVKSLKNLGLRMGNEINKSINIGDEFTESLDKGKLKLKNTWNRMIVMSQKAGISWKMWLAVFAVVCIWFFWVWLF